MRTVIAATALALAITGPPFAAPQTPIGRFEGTVKGSLASRPVSAAQVSLVRLESDTSISVSVRVDARGRFSVDSLPAGHYLVQVSHPTLDSLDVALPTDRLVIADGRTSHSDLTLPSGASLRDVVCPRVRLSAEKAVIAGHIFDADSDVPIAGAKIVVEWNDITIDRKSRRVATLRRMAVVSTGRLGEYRLCGVPAELPLSIQVQHADRAGAAIQLRVTAAEGVVVRDLSLSLRSAPTIAAFDSIEGSVGKLRVDSTAALALTGDGDAMTSAQAPGAATSAELTLSGSAMIAGTVSSVSGQPVEGAEVRVRDALSTTVTDKSGQFVLNGLPSGTQVLLVRRLGFGLAEIPVAASVRRAGEKGRAPPTRRRPRFRSRGCGEVVAGGLRTQPKDQSSGSVSHPERDPAEPRQEDLGAPSAIGRPDNDRARTPREATGDELRSPGLALVQERERRHQRRRGTGGRRRRAESDRRDRDLQRPGSRPAPVRAVAPTAA